jgi:LemA protein
MNKKVIGCLAIVVVVGLIVALWATGLYNGLVGAEQAVEAQWAQVENVYQRRADLIPNLVNTVRGSAEFERGTLNDVIEARSRVGQMTVSPEILSNPDAFRQFEAAQGELSSALSRLLVTVERYPELRSTQAFRDLMGQLESTENRISVERRRFNEEARDFNTRIRRVPASWLISALGWPFDEVPYFTADPGSDQAPEVDFDFGE